jgi:hypothetical protein
MAAWCFRTRAHLLDPQQAPQLVLRSQIRILLPCGERLEKLRLAAARKLLLLLLLLPPALFPQKRLGSSIGQPLLLLWQGGGSRRGVGLLLLPLLLLPVRGGPGLCRALCPLPLGSWPLLLLLLWLHAGVVSGSTKGAVRGRREFAIQALAAAYTQSYVMRGRVAVSARQHAGRVQSSSGGSAPLPSEHSRRLLHLGASRPLDSDC